MASLSDDLIPESSLNIEGKDRDILSVSDGSTPKKSKKVAKGGAIRMNTEGSFENETSRMHQLHKKDKVVSGQLLTETPSSLSIAVGSRYSVENYSLFSTDKESPYKLSGSSNCMKVVLPIIEQIIIAATESTINPSMDNSSLMHESSLRTQQYNNIKNKQKGKVTKNSILNLMKHEEKKSSNILSKGLHSVVTHLGLPIFIAKPQPFMRATLSTERIVLDTQNQMNDATIYDREKRQQDKTMIADKSSWKTNNDDTLSPFVLIRSFGFNPRVPSLNISSYDRSIMFFTNSQFIVRYNIKDDIMSFLHGHQNNVSCIGVDSQGDLLASGDNGPNCRVVIWDTSLTVLKIIENEHLRGVDLLALSWDGEYLITVSSPPEQCIQLWHWKVIITHPVSIKFSNRNLGAAKRIVIHPKRSEEFSIVYENGIEFVIYDRNSNCDKTQESFQYDFYQNSFTLGVFTDTVFLDFNETSAIASTSKGYAVVWVENESKHIKQRKINKKHVRIHSEWITHIVTVDNLIATATVTGKISFFDLELAVLYWTYKLPFGEFVSFSFNLTAMRNEQHSSDTVDLSCEIQHTDIFDATLKNRPFYVRPLIVTSANGKIVYLNLNEAKTRILLFSPDAVYTAIDIHPKNNYLCAGTSKGQCFLIDFVSNKIKVSYQIDLIENVCQAVSVIKYSPLGNHLACGMYTGDVWLLDPLLLTPTLGSPVNDCSKCIIKMVFSDDDKFLAISDQSYCLTVYKLEDKIITVGEYQAHSNYISDIMFANGSPNERKLYTIGEDRTMVEFSISEENDTLKFITVHRIEQTAIPKCIISHPTQDNNFLVVNSEMKFKFLRKIDMRCCKTVQAPMFGCPITYLHAMERYLIFGTAHHIGLHLLPLDGNPYKTLGYLASSSPIICIRVHSSGKYLFTISENSTAINMWKINTSAVDKIFSQGGEGLDAFLSVLGRENSFLEKELRDFFLVGNFLHQGETPGVIRRLSNTIHVCEVPSIFQALGFFLSKVELDNIIYELTVCYNLSNKKTISFEEFVKLFINHRPTIQLSVKDMKQAFNDFYDGTNFNNVDYKPTRHQTDPVFDSLAFIGELSKRGDIVPFEDLSNALGILCENNPDVMNDCEDESLPFMPRHLNLKTFITDILGYKNPID